MFIKSNTIQTFIDTGKSISELSEFVLENYLKMLNSESFPVPLYIADNF